MKQLVSLILMLLPMAASAYDAQIDGIYYNLDKENKTAEVTSNPNKYSGDIIIPEEISYSGSNYVVTTFGEDSFKDCNMLTSITISKNIIKFGYHAFSGCTGLEAVYISDLAAWCNINVDWLFLHDIASTSPISYAKHLFLNGNEIIDLEIPEGVEKIGSCCFLGCSSLSSVTIPNSIKSIGHGAFAGCSGLTSVYISDIAAWCDIFFGDGASDLYNNSNPLTTANHLFLNGEEIKEIDIPNSVSSISNYAFYGFNNLKKITIPNSVTSIGGHAFEGCSSITNISLHPNIESIGSHAFADCSNLSSVTLLCSPSTVDSDIFSGCSKLTDVTLDCEKVSPLFSDMASIERITFGKAVNTIEKNAFQNCSGLSSIIVQCTPTSYGSDYNGNSTIFSGCSNLKKVTFDCETVAPLIRRITSIEEVTLGENVTTINDYAFQNCSGLTSMSIPNNLNSVGYQAFAGCSGLETVEFHCKTIDSWFSGLTSLKEIIIGEEVTTIGNQAFQNCSNLANVSIPDNVTYVGANAFTGTAWYNNMDDGVVYAGNIACGYKGTMPSNTEIVIKEGTIGLAANIFSGCNGLTSITIPRSLKSIGDNAFYRCNNLKTVNISDLAAWCAIDFTKNYSNPNSYLYLNGEKVDFYNFTIPNGTKRIGNYAFYNSSFSSISIPNSVEAIGIGAFENCYNLHSITLPDGVKSIGENAFYKTMISEVTIPQSVTAIGNNAFYFFSYSSVGSAIKINISDLKSWCGITFASSIAPKKTLLLNGEIIKDLVIPDGVTTISSFAFYGCESLEFVSLPSSLTSIGTEAFTGCNSLAKIVSKINNPFVLSDPIFTNESICHLFVPNGTLSQYQENWSAFTHIYEGDGNRPNDAIEFEDLLVETICVNNWDTNQDGFFSPSEAAAVTDLGSAFNSNVPSITSFDELKYFTGLKSIPSSIFSGCIALKSVTIPEGVTSIGAYAFNNCRSLSSLTIPASVTSIGSKAFFYALDAEIYSQAMSQPSRNDFKVYISDLTAWCNIDFGTDVFSEVEDKYTYSQTWMYLGCTQKYSLYLNNKYLSTLEIPKEITEIKPNTFAYCRSISSVKFHDGVTSIGNNAFRFSLVSSISGGKNINSIGDHAFEDTDISDISSFENLTSIGTYAFALTGLKTLVMSNKIESIGYSAFWSCTSLSDVVLSESLKSLQSSTFSGCTGLKNMIIPQSVTSIGNSVFEKCDNLKYVIITSDNLLSFAYSNSYKFKVIVPHTVYEKGVVSNVKNFVTYNSEPMFVELKSKGATSAVLDVYPINDDGSLDEKNMATVTTVGQTPGQYLNWKLDKDCYGIISEKANETVTLTVQEPNALSTKKARLLATAEEADDLEHYGFEWRRIESSDMIKSNVVSAPLFNGTIVGTLNNLNPEVEYKYRPFYKSDSGEMFYGEWIGLFTGDADVFFEAEVYTKDAEDITKVSALLAGVWLEGTDDIEEKGFEYWTVSGSKTRAVGSDVKKVAVSGSGNAMTTTLEGLKSGATYGFRSYVKTSKGKMTYGEEKTFKTILIGDVDGDGKLTNADADAIAKHIIGKTPKGFNKKMADVNEDDHVNIVDIVYLLNMIE